MYYCVQDNVQGLFKQIKQGFDLAKKKVKDISSNGNRHSYSECLTWCSNMSLTTLTNICLQLKARFYSITHLRYERSCVFLILTCLRVVTVL